MLKSGMPENELVLNVTPSFNLLFGLQPEDPKTEVYLGCAKLIAAKRNERTKKIDSFCTHLKRNDVVFFI